MQPEQTLTRSILRWLRAPYEQRVPGSAIAGLALLTAGIILASGCTVSANNPIAVSLDEDFELGVGQSALVSSVDLEIGFQTVSSDSRCGKGEQCITEGDAVVRIWLRMAGGAREERELHTGSKLPRVTDYANLSIGLVALHPAAISGRAIESQDYIGVFRVARGFSGDRVIY